MRVIDYDKIEEWAPWLTAIIESIAPAGFLTSLRRLILAEQDRSKWLGEERAREEELLALLQPCP